MTMIDQCASRTSGVGATYQQLLSSVAHGQLHGLSRFVMRAPTPAEPDKVIVQMNLAAHDAALHLLVGPLCAAALVEHPRWFFGWNRPGLVWPAPPGPAMSAMAADAGKSGRAVRDSLRRCLSRRYCEHLPNRSIRQ
jgi:hypothetical protein